VVKNQSKSCQKVLKKLSKIVNKIVKKVVKIVKKLSKSCQNVVKKLSKSAQKVVKKLSKSCQNCQKVVKKLYKFKTSGEDEEEDWGLQDQVATSSHLVKISHYSNHFLRISQIEPYCQPVVGYEIR
jgi:HSP90 family molecular chaperone